MENCDKEYSLKLYNKERLKLRNDISVFFNKKNSIKRLSNFYYTIFILKNNRSYSRFAAAIKRNKANAVCRNRAKRIVREVYRLEKSKIPMGYDYFIIINKFDDSHSYSFNNCKKNLLKLFQKV